MIENNEIIGMVMRAVEGITVDDTTLAFDEIRKAGPGGHFVSSRHTRRYMHTEQFRPQLSDRVTRDKWNAAGAKDARERAAEKAKEVLSRPLQSVLPAEIRTRIKNEIPDIKRDIMD